MQHFQLLVNYSLRKIFSSHLLAFQTSTTFAATHLTGKETISSFPDNLLAYTFSRLTLKTKALDIAVEGFLGGCLTMTYFHTGCSTIIGAKSFHGPVRDGKGWYQLAIVIRHNL